MPVASAAATNTLLTSLVTAVKAAGNTARVLCGNIPTSNATVFIMDKVLMPAPS